jgi:hypothetical protein
MHGQSYGGMPGNQFFSRPMDFASLGKFTQLSPAVKSHLSRVYATLSGGLLAVALGVYIDEKFRVSGLATQLLFIAMAVGLNMITGETKTFLSYLELKLYTLLITWSPDCPYYACKMSSAEAFFTNT